MAAKLQTADELAKPKNLVTKLSEILAEIGAVEKGGKNEKFNYSYIKEADVSNLIREAMGKKGVFCLPSVEEITEKEYTTSNNNTMHWVRVKVKYTLINADDPADRLEAIHYGDGSDSAEKGIYKALTGCHKYALLRIFCLGSEDDPENEKGHAAPTEEKYPAWSQPKAITSGASIALKIPFEEKDKYKAVLKAAGYRWHAESKTWRGTQPIPSLAKYQVTAQSSDEAPPPPGDEFVDYQDA